MTCAQFDERKVEDLVNGLSLVGLIEREKHTPPFPREVWDHFRSLKGGREQMKGEYIPAYEKAFAEAVQHLQDIGVLTIDDDGAYVIFESDDGVLNPKEPDGRTLYFVDKKDAEQYSHFWGPAARVRKLSSE